MERITFVILTSVLILVSAHPAHAELMLSLSSPDDLDNLNISQIITVNVTLSGLGDTEEFESLGADIPINDAVFSTPMTLSAGTIVPDATNNFDAFSSADFDLVTGAFFLDTGPTGINLNGLFYSFTMTVDADGSGTITLDSNSLFAEAIGGQAVSITAGNPLAYTVTIPEPTTSTILGIIGITWLGNRRRNVTWCV